MNFNTSNYWRGKQACGGLVKDLRLCQAGTGGQIDIYRFILYISNNTAYQQIYTIQ